MIDISAEQLIAVNKAHAYIPGRPHRSTVWRWLLRGVGGQKLETVIVGGRRFTSREAIERFVSRRTAPGEPTPQDNRRRAARIAAADRILDDSGI